MILTPYLTGIKPAAETASLIIGTPVQCPDIFRCVPLPAGKKQDLALDLTTVSPAVGRSKAVTVSGANEDTPAAAMAPAYDICGMYRKQ